MNGVEPYSHVGVAFESRFTQLWQLGHIGGVGINYDSLHATLEMAGEPEFSTSPLNITVSPGSWMECDDNGSVSSDLHMGGAGHDRNDGHGRTVWVAAIYQVLKQEKDREGTADDVLLTRYIGEGALNLLLTHELRHAADFLSPDLVERHLREVNTLPRDQQLLEIRARDFAKELRLSGEILPMITIDANPSLELIEDKSAIDYL